jgi:hypothetical protein
VLLVEHHQIVFLPPELADTVYEAGNDAHPREQQVRRILFRAKAPFSEAFSQRKRPDELNSAPDGPNGSRPFGEVSTNVTLLCGQDRAVEDSALLATVQAVGTAARFRQIWEESYHWVRVFRQEQQKADVGTQRRTDLEYLVDRLGNLEFDLTFSVEFPLIRVGGTDPALSKLLDLEHQAETLSQMFTQLGGSVRSEIIAIDIRERQANELRKRQRAFAANVLTILGVTVGLTLAFLGINAQQVNNQWSIFDLSHYERYYLAAIGLGLVPSWCFRPSGCSAGCFAAPASYPRSLRTSRSTSPRPAANGSIRPRPPSTRVDPAVRSCATSSSTGFRAQLLHVLST